MPKFTPNNSVLFFPPKKGIKNKGNCDFSSHSSDFASHNCEKKSEFWDKAEIT